MVIANIVISVIWTQERCSESNELKVLIITTIFVAEATTIECRRRSSALVDLVLHGTYGHNTHWYDRTHRHS
jgi:hypothetical protein